jgi:hypothetical protein
VIKLTTSNSGHQMMQLRKMQIVTTIHTQAQLVDLSPTLIHNYLSTPLNTQLQMLFLPNQGTLLEKLSPATINIKLKKFYTATPHIKKPSASIQLKKLPSTNLQPKNKLSITYHTLTKLQKPHTTRYIRLKMLSTVSLN